MKILLDECIPRKLKYSLPRHECQTVPGAGSPARRTAPSLFAAATSYTGFDYISEKTLYSRWGDWFPLLCATIAIACLIGERVA